MAKANKQSEQTKTSPERVKKLKMTKDLICNLTREEVANYADSLAQLIDRESSTNSEFASIKKAWNGKIEDIKRDIQSTSTKVREHKELRLVKCEKVLDFDAGEVREVRLDTGEIIGTRPMSSTERQKELDFDGNLEDEFDGDMGSEDSAA
jgi:hypothetical protein